MKYYEIRYVENGDDVEVGKFIVEAKNIADANRQFKLLAQNTILSIQEVNSAYGFLRELFQ